MLEDVILLLRTHTLDDDLTRALIITALERIDKAITLKYPCIVEDLLKEGKDKTA